MTETASTATDATTGAADATGTAAGDADKGGKPDYTPPATQADLDKIITERVIRERAKFADYDSLKTAAQKLRDLEEAQKTDAQKEADARAALERENAELKLAKLRSEVAEAKSDPAKGLVIPASLLTGSTREEIEAAADQLIASWGTKTQVGVHLPNQDKAPEKQKADLAETAKKIFGG